MWMFRHPAKFYFPLNLIAQGFSLFRENPYQGVWCFLVWVVGFKLLSIRTA